MFECLIVAGSVLLGFEINFNIFEVEVGHIVVLSVDFAIDRVQHGAVFEVSGAGADSAAGQWVECADELSLGCDIWADDEEELEGHATMLALGDHQVLGELATAGEGSVRELSFSLLCNHDVLVKVIEAGLGCSVVQEFAVRIAADDGLAGLQAVLEDVEHNEVLAVVIEVNVLSELIVFRANVHANRSFLCLFRLNCELEVEILVIQTGSAGLDVE